jgi:hypothetical protein
MGEDPDPSVPCGHPAFECLFCCVVMKGREGKGKERQGRAE